MTSDTSDDLNEAKVETPKTGPKDMYLFSTSRGENRDRDRRVSTKALRVRDGE